MDLFSKCKALYEKIRYFEYGIPVDGVIKPVPSPEYFAQNYRFLKPEEFEKYGGGICWDYVEYERKCLEVNDIDFNQYYLITNTPPNYDTHTFITVKDGDDLIYIESSFKRVEHIIDGVQKFKSLEDIVRLITTNMWYCNDNDKHFDEFKYDVCKFKGHPKYGCTCQEYMDWMDDNSDIVIQDVSINPKKINEDELAVEEFSVNKIDTKFTQFVCESVNDPEEYDEALHDHIDDEDDVYNESWTDFKNGVHPSSGLMFHVSLKNDMDGKTINPQLPSYITDGGKLDDNYQEDTKTKRLCVSPSIEGCLIAILNYKKIREHVGDKFYVYTPEKPFSEYKHKTNKEIVKDKLVFDANITKEAWILEPCKLKLYGIIKLKKVKDLKKKPTVEKNIKMNTIKLDYEWIMTPKASGKFNKAIGDSPDEEDDKKEKPIKEYDNILVSNDEFFMEASKNPDIKARKRTVKNLRKLGVDRAHEVDSKKLERGIDINVKDSYGDTHRTRISSNNIYPTAYVDNLGTINITPETMSSNKFESAFNHEAGHLEQINRKDYNISDTKSKTTYTVSDKDSYPIKCAKLFLQKNANKMNEHDKQWTELHADFLSCKKSGFGKMMKLIHSFKKSKQNIESTCDELTKWNDNCCKNLVDRYSRYTVKDKAHGDYERQLTQEEVEDIFSLCNKSKEKLEHYRNILMERFYNLEDKSDEDNLSADYQKKLSKLMRKIFDKSKEISNKIQDFAEIYKHHGVNISRAQSFNTEMKLQLDSFNRQLKDFKSYSTTYDYRVKFMEDMMNIHKGHPGRCSMKYPPMTPADKKYMQEADCILISNEEFFTESSKHKNRMKKFIGNLDHVPTAEELKQMTTGRVDEGSEPPMIDTDSERDVFENRKKQFKSQSPSEYVKHNTDKKLVDKDNKTLKEYTRREMEAAGDGLMSPGYSDEGLDPNKIKSKNIKKTLKRMGYDPKTRTIESNIPDPKDPSKTLRTRLLIDDSSSKSMGAHASRDIENPTIGIPRKQLKFRNNASLGITAHENGHLYDLIHPEATADMHKAAKEEIERKHDDLLGVGRITDPDTGETIERSTSKPSSHFNPRERVADAIGLANTSKHTMRNNIEKSMRVFDDKDRRTDKFEKQLNNTRFAKEQLRNMDKDDSLREDLIKSANDDAESKYGSYRMDTLDPRKNVIGKPDTSKLTRESCLIMDNDEFFGLMK